MCVVSCSFLNTDIFVIAPSYWRSGGFFFNSMRYFPFLTKKGMYGARSEASAVATVEVFDLWGGCAL